MIWLNGELSAHSTLAASNAGTLLGWGVFTTVGIRDGKPLWWDKHLARLRRDAARGELPIAFTDEEMSAGLRTVLAAQAIENGLARLTLTMRGDGRWNSASGSDLSILAHAQPQTATVSCLRVGVAPHPYSRFQPFAGVKATSYLPFFWSWRQGKANGWDEVLLTDENGRIVEAARSTPFWVENGTLCTPSLKWGGLQGVGRDVVLEWAQANQRTVQQGAFSLHDLKRAQEAFLISAGSGPRPLQLEIPRETEPQNEVTVFENNSLLQQLLAWWQKNGAASW